MELTGHIRDALIAQLRAFPEPQTIAITRDMALQIISLTAHVDHIERELVKLRERIIMPIVVPNVAQKETSL